MLESRHGNRELGHWMEVVGAAVEELHDELGYVGSRSPLSGQITDLLLGWDLAGQEEPEETWHRQHRALLDRGYNEPSGSGSWPPGALGRTSWHSGIYGK